MTREVIVIGGGVNGLVAAAYLAKAGVPVLVVEARETPGGLAGSDELAGCDAGWFLPDIAQHLGLGAAGLELVVPEASVFSLLEDGGSLTLWTDPPGPRRRSRGSHPRTPAAGRRSPTISPVSPKCWRPPMR